MCYTSGTTGNPKGVVYTHRSTFLHTMGAMTADSARRPRVRPHPAGRADVPRQRLGPRPRRRRRRRRPRHARPDLSGQGDRRPRRRGAGHGRGRRADDLDAGAARAEGSRHVGAAGDPVRRFGRAEGAVGGVPRAARAADPAGVGHDRDEPGRRRSRRLDADQQLLPAGRAGRAARRRQGRADVRRRVPRRRARHARAGARATASRAASCSAAATGSRRRTTTTRGRARASPTTAGCAPATWRRWTSAAGSASSTARRTSSSRAASGSRRSSWRTS